MLTWVDQHERLAQVDHVVMYRDADGKWRWRFKAARNGHILAQSPHGYRREKDCRAAIRRVTGRLPCEYVTFGDPVPECTGWADVQAVVHR